MTKNEKKHNYNWIIYVVSVILVVIGVILIAKTQNGDSLLGQKLIAMRY